MNNKKYSLSFTSGALLRNKSIVVAKLFMEMGDWNYTRDRVIAENLLQVRTLNASKRVFREISSRLKQLTVDEFKLLQDGSYQEQSYLLWLAVCKRYNFIYDFAVEVIREKYLRFDLDLSFEEYDIFFNTKAEWHPEVERIAEATRLKQRQIVFKMTREAEILSLHNRIQPAILTASLIDVIRQDSVAHFAIFPVSDSDVRG